MYSAHLNDIKKLSPGGLRRRFILILAFLFLIDNPTAISALELLRGDAAPAALRITMTLVICTILIMLIRHTWTAMRLLGVIAVWSLILALTSLLWYLQEWIALNETTRYFARISVIAVVLTFGQVVPFYVRKFSGISAVLKEPP